MTLNFTFPCAYLVSALPCEEASVSSFFVANNLINGSCCSFPVHEANLSVRGEISKWHAPFRLQNSES